MKIFLDTAEVDQIAPAYETGLIDGVTTNPTLILKSGRSLFDVAKELITSFPELKSISTEVVADTAEEMITQAEKFIPLSPKVITIKVPCTVEGLKACRILSKEGANVNVTLVFSTCQAILAAKAGATYISPFIGRCEDNNIDGIELINSIKTVFKLNSITTNILAASIRNIDHINDSYKAGADIVTLPPKIFEEMYNHVLTNKGLAQFDKDWKELNK